MRNASTPRFLLWVVLAFAATRVAAVIGAAVALAPTVPLRQIPNYLAIRWDGDWYQLIAIWGYDSADELFDDLRTGCSEPAPANCRRGDADRHSNLAFFPLFPLLIRALASLGLDPWFSALLIAWVAAFAAAVLVGLLARDVLGDRAGMLAVVLWGVWPANIVLSSGRPEPLFVALSAGALLLVLRGRLMAAALAAATVGLLRFQAIAVVLPVVLSAWVRRDPDWRRGAAVTLVAALGLIGSLLFLGSRAGSPLGWFDVQREWKSTNDWGVGKLAYLQSSLDASLITVWMAAATMVLAVGLFIAGLAMRLPWQLSVYSGVLLAGVLVQASYHEHSMRFLLVAFPLVFPAAAWMRRWPSVLLAVVVALLLVVSALLQIPLWREGLAF